jgi:CheY-like chemotaxis protein
MTESKRAEAAQLLAPEHRLLSGFGTDFQVLLFPFNMPSTGHRKTGPEGIEIVLIEDNSIDASIILNVIEVSKYKCTPVVKTNGIDALNHLRNASDSTIAERTLVLLDLVLPGMSGLDFLAQLRQEPRVKAVPVVILTASTKPGHILAAAEHKVVSYMTKPASLKQFNMLAKALDELLGALFSPPIVRASAGKVPSIGPTFIGQSNERLTGNPELR